MARYTLLEAQEFYKIAKTAYKNALTNKKYDIRDRSKENQYIKDLKTEMDYWADIIDQLQNGASSAPTVKKMIPYV